MANVEVDAADGVAVDVDSLSGVTCIPRDRSSFRAKILLALLL